MEKQVYREVSHLFFNALYEKLPLTGIVRDVAVFTAVGIDRQGNRRILGVSVEVKEAELHWREFLECPVRRGLSGVEHFARDARLGVKAVRKAERLILTLPTPFVGGRENLILYPCRAEMYVIRNFSTYV